MSVWRNTRGQKWKCNKKGKKQKKTLQTEIHHHRANNQPKL